MDEDQYTQVFFENNLESRVDENEKSFTQKMWPWKAISTMTKILSLLHKPVDEGVLVRSDIQMRTRELVMLQCVAFPVDVSATLVLKETTFLQPHLPTQLVLLTFFVPSWRVHLDLQTLFKCLFFFIGFLLLFPI